MTQDARYGFPGQFCRGDLLWYQRSQLLLLLRRGRCLQSACHRAAEFTRQIRILLTWVAACSRGNLCREQRGQDTVLVGGPDRAVATQKRCPSTFFTGEAKRTAVQAIREPLEPHRHFEEAAAKSCREPVDQSAANDRFAHRNALRPVNAIPEQVVDGHCQIVVRYYQA